MMAPNMTMDTRKLTLDATRKIPMWKRLGGRIGSGAFLSQRTNTVRIVTAAIERAMMIGEPHAYWVPPQTVTSSAEVTPSIISPAPRKSIWWDWRRKGSLRTAEVTMRAWMPRKAISWPMFWLTPDSADPTRKTTMANWKMPFRPN